MTGPGPASGPVEAVLFDWGGTLSGGVVADVAR